MVTRKNIVKKKYRRTKIPKHRNIEKQKCRKTEIPWNKNVMVQKLRSAKVWYTKITRVVKYRKTLTSKVRDKNVEKHTSNLSTPIFLRHFDVDPCSVTWWNYNLVIVNFEPCFFTSRWRYTDIIVIWKLLNPIEIIW